MGDLIPADIYRYVYFAVAALPTVLVSLSGEPLRPEPGKASYHKALLLGIFYILFFGLRPTSGIWMADTEGYVNLYHLIQDNKLSNLHGDHEQIWEYICAFIGKAGCAPWVWLTVVAAIYILFNIWASRIIFPHHVYLAFLFYTVFFLFYSGGINGIRNADAYSIVFFAMAVLYRPGGKWKYFLAAGLCWVGYQFHSSVLVTILSFVLSIFIVRKTNLAICIWLAAIIVSLTAGNYLANIASGYIDDERAMKYLMYGQNSKMMAGFSHTGFRWDFLFFSALPILFGWYVTVKRQVKDRFFQILLNTYIIANAVWVVFIYAAFSNRFAMLSWCIYPYVVCYPLIKIRLWDNATQNRVMTLAFWIMLLFSGYMNVFV